MLKLALHAIDSSDLKAHGSSGRDVAPGETTMTAKPNTVADIRRQIIELESQLAELAKISSPGRALLLGRASDLLTEARACELYRLR
jgi:hypothetical protein